jgi:very-short-patch-repair endonuclease
MREQKFQNCNDALVAILNNQKDFATLQNNHWYRIPVKSAPKNILNDEAKVIAFYQTSIFKEEKWAVNWFGTIKTKTIVNRHDLFPDEPLNSVKSKKLYYKIEIEQLKQLSQPIVSTTGRRITFIPTTTYKLFKATEINLLFNDSPLEDSLYDAMLKYKIPCERQWHVAVDSKNFILDFVVFCNSNNIAIECDGDKYHDAKQQVHDDKHRDNNLKTQRLSVMRFTTEKIQQQMEETIKLIKEAIESQGGLKRQKGKNVIHFRTTPQMGLFDVE